MSKLKQITTIIGLFVLSQTAFSQLGVGCSTSSMQITEYNEEMLNYQIQENNLKNLMTWTDAWAIHSLAGMYEVTKKRKYLDKMIELVDAFESKKNDTETGVLDHFMNKRAPSWLSYIKKWDPETGEQQKGPEVYTNIIQTSMLLLPIVTCAKTILSQPKLLSKKTKHGGITGSTYGEKANYYIKSSLESINFFIDNGWLNENTYLFEDRSNRFKEYDEVTNPIEPLAFNRMFNMGRTMKELALACELTKKEEFNEYINLTEKVLHSMVAYYKDNIFIEKKNGTTQYYWYYKMRTYSKLVYEDLGHLGLDIDCLHYFYSINENHYGLQKSDFEAISNTILQTVYSKEENGFYGLMNGTGKISKKGFQNFIQLSYYSPEIFDLICNYSYENKRKFYSYRFVQLMEFENFSKNQ
tara:strand:- start:6343 stop:7578 length:1236 start_codon:yes stop_codon:yes gene_type:complete